MPSASWYVVPDSSRSPVAMVSSLGYWYLLYSSLAILRIGRFHKLILSHCTICRELAPMLIHR
jgi:hypothetical protein